MLVLVYFVEFGRVVVYPAVVRAVVHAPKFHKQLDKHQHLARLRPDPLKVKTRKPLPPTKDTDCVVTDNFVTNAPRADSGDVPA